jgi:hypothetical protein
MSFRKVKKYLYLFILELIFIGNSCNSERNITGTYRSNFAEMGFFSSKLKLKPDSSFEYYFRGDLIFDTATGNYCISKRKLILTYDQTPIDTSQFVYLRALGFNFDTPQRSDENHSHIYYIRKNKLYVSFQDGKIVRKAHGYSERKKYVLFGTHYFKMRYYLNRIE